MKAFAVLFCVSEVAWRGQVAAGHKQQLVRKRLVQVDGKVRVECFVKAENEKSERRWRLFAANVPEAPVVLNANCI